MADILSDRSARDAVLRSVRAALGGTAPDAERRAAALAYIAAHAQGPRPAMPASASSRLRNTSESAQPVMRHASVTFGHA